jgi:hypothetical protein
LNDRDTGAEAAVTTSQNFILAADLQLSVEPGMRKLVVTVRIPKLVSAQSIWSLL